MLLALGKLLKAEKDEMPALLWAFAYFFCLLCSYYILRPVRDEMGIQGGVDKLQWLFVGTFIAMLVAVPIFGWLSSRWPRQKLIPIVYYFFAINLLGFYFLLQSNLDKVVVARSFFIWVSVFNLFVISVFWSFMADIFSNQQARRFFGFVSAGGSTGAICGPLFTGALVGKIGTSNLLLISAVFLCMSIYAVSWLSRWAESRVNPTNLAPNVPLGGGILAGIKLTFSSPYLLGISLYLLLLTLLATFVYFEQLRMVAAQIPDSVARTQLFAHIERYVSIGTLLVEVFLTNRLVGKFGVAILLMILPLLNIVGFAALMATPTLAVLIGFQGLRRIVEYAVARPVREILFTVVTREEKYKAKNFIDTVVYRGGDAFSGWLSALLKTMGMALATVASLAIPVAIAAALVGWLLGRKQETLKNQHAGDQPLH